MPADFAPLLDSLRAAGEPRRFAAGEVVFRRGERPLALYWVLGGELRLLRRSANGDEVLLQRCQGGPFAEASIFSPTYHCDGIATQPSETLRISRLGLDALIEEPEFARRYVRWLSAALRDMRARCERLSLPRARDRIMHALADNGPLRHGETHGSLKAWASELGLSHETLYRTLAELERRGQIERRAGEITLTKQ